MNTYTPDLFPTQRNSVPHDEGMAILASIRREIEAMPEPDPDRSAPLVRRLSQFSKPIAI